MEGDALKTFQNDLLYSNKKVSLPTGESRRKHYTTQAADADKRRDQLFWSTSEWILLYDSA